MPRSFPCVSLSIFVVLAGSVIAGCANQPDTLDCGNGTVQVGHECVTTADTNPPDTSETPEAPTPPTFGGVTSVAPVNTDTLQVTWAPATDKVTSAAKLKYNVYAGTTPGGEGFGKPVAVSAPGANHVLLPGLLPANAAWYVVVRAVNEAGAEDNNTIEKTATTGLDTEAPTFGGVSGVAPDASGVAKLTWEPASDKLSPKEAISYLLFYADKPENINFDKPAGVTDPGASSGLIHGLAPKTTYSFVVRARDAAGNVDPNKVVKTGTPGDDHVPPVFSGCKSAVAIDAASATVYWDPATDDTTPQSGLTYEVFTAEGKPGIEVLTGAPAGKFTAGNSGVVTGLKKNTDYYFICRAVDASGNVDSNTAEVTAHTKPDSMPPTFAGATGTTNITATSIDVTFAPATDDVSPPANITYSVYMSLTSKGEDYTKPASATKMGDGPVSVGTLQPGTKYYFVVKAKDAAGNEDKNTVEVSATTLVSYSLNIEPFFKDTCAKSGCHSGTAPTGNMNLSPGFARLQTVGVPCEQDPPTLRIKAGDSANSYLYKKITGMGKAGYLLMPPPSTGTILTEDQKNMIKLWIDQGALNN